MFSWPWEPGLGHQLNRFVLPVLLSIPYITQRVDIENRDTDQLEDVDSMLDRIINDQLTRKWIPASRENYEFNLRVNGGIFTKFSGYI